MSDNPQKPSGANWPKDEFGRSEIFSQWWLLWLGILLAVLGFLISHWAPRLFSSRPVVVVYCAQDQVYAEAIFADFQKATGIQVRPVYDSEAVKTVGLANRLIAESPNPQCDVFWANEEMRTRQLAARGLFDRWAAFGARSRQMVFNTNLLKSSQLPRSLLQLTNVTWRGKIAVAYPQFGTTATHVHALRQAWGQTVWENWCRGLAANKTFLVDGNSVVVRLVGQGEAALGLTDSDDIAAGVKAGMPIAPAPSTPETLSIPNTVALVRGAPHPQAARQLFDFFQSAPVVQRLVSAKALQTGSAGSVPGALRVNWDRLLGDLEPTSKQIDAIFLR